MTIIGNWKMNGSLREVHSFIQDSLTYHEDHTSATIALCPPFPYLHALKTAFPKMALGGQNCAAFERGAYTGEVSALMLKDIGCEYVIIGHSERRTYYQEVNETICAKIEQALKADLTPILCVGETEKEHEQDLTQDVVEGQIRDTYLSERIIIAYEPVWAIGTGKIPTIEAIQSIHDFIKTHTKPSTKVLYGGSVNEDNAHALSAIKSLDGFLVGGASLRADSFYKIVQAFLARG